MRGGEQDITRAVLEAVNRSGLAVVWRNQSGQVRVARGVMRLAPEGSPDIVGFTRHGRFVGIETKAPKARTSKDRRESQEGWRALIRAAGGIALVVTSAQEAVDLLSAEVRGGKTKTNAV